MSFLLTLCPQCFMDCVIGIYYCTECCHCRRYGLAWRSYRRSFSSAEYGKIIRESFTSLHSLKQVVWPPVHTSFKVKGHRSRSPGQLMLRPEVRHIFRKERPTNFKLASQSMWSVWQVLAHNSRTQSPRNTKISRNVVYHTGNNAHQVRGQRSEVKVTRLIIAETESVSPTNLKLGRQLEHALSAAMASYVGLWSWIIARGRGHTGSAAPGGGHTTCLYCICFCKWMINWLQIN